MNTLAYGTYQRFEYQTINLQPLKSALVTLCKILGWLIVFAAMLIVALAVFQAIYVATSFAIAWLVMHGLQLCVVAGVFVGAWFAQPKVKKS